MTKGALDGVKVADFSWYAAGPIITKYLAAHGAIVIHIESSIRPDLSRLSPPFKDNKPGINRSGCFAASMCGKYGITLNLNHPRGVEIAKRIVAWSDVVVENFTPGTMAKWGLAYNDLKKLKSDIIMLSSSNQGQTGPRANFAGFGTQLVSLAGFTHLTGWPDRAPVGVFGAYTDCISPLFACVALIAALTRRHRIGKGMYMDISQNEVALHFLAPYIMDYAVNGRDWNRAGNQCTFAPHGAYRCRGSERWCAIAVFTDDEWHNLCKVIGRTELANDPDFATLTARKQNEDKVDKLIEQWTINFTPEEVMGWMQAAGVPAGVVESPEDMRNDPQLEQQHYYWFFDHPEMGRCCHDGIPFKLSKTPAELRMPAACLGEHNEYVYTKILGMSDGEFVELLKEGVFE